MWTVLPPGRTVHMTRKKSLRVMWTVLPPGRTVHMTRKKTCRIDFNSFPRTVSHSNGNIQKDEKVVTGTQKGSYMGHKYIDN